MFGTILIKISFRCVLFSKVIGVQPRNFCSLWEKHVVRKEKRMIDQRDHILATDFKIIASGMWFIGPVMKTKRYTKSFIPFAIKLLNLDSSLWELLTFITAQNNWTPIMQTRTRENFPNILIRLRVGSQVDKNWANKSKTQGTTQKYKSQGQNLLG